MPIDVVLNGSPRSFPDLSDPTGLEEVVAGLGLRGDRVAVEHNGQIVARNRWRETVVRAGDRLEVVHFVGGGSRPRTGAE